MHVIFHHVGFAYDDSGADILTDLTAHFAPGWTGVVGPNGAGKSTLLKLATGLLAPLSGSVQVTGRTLYCAQRTDRPPADLVAFIADQTGEARRLQRDLAVDADWPERWDSLSHGERKRAQVAVALWLAPDVLAIDEPTGHLDEEARDLLRRSLSAFSGVGMLVSHDRALLDELCARCLFLERGAGTVRHGNYSQASREREREREAAGREQAKAAEDARRLREVRAERRRRADQAAARRSARGLARHDSDGRARRRLAVVTGKDGRAGRLTSQLDARLRRAESRLATAPRTRVQPRGIWLAGAHSPRHTVLELEEGSLPLGAGRRIVHPAVAVGREDHIALTGPNGAGKTTLLHRLLGASTLPAARLVHVPQEITAAQSGRLLDDVTTSDDATLGRLLTVVSRLGSSPHQLLASNLPSPGETRKLLLALGIVRKPHLVVMDEPTNHLDLPAIECLEDALAEAPCALLLVSHDRRFLSRLCSVEWRLEVVGAETRLRVLPMTRPDGDDHASGSALPHLCE
jgi:ATPase subunit of ABC transporter with duplicated ATPase domains